MQELTSFIYYVKTCFILYYILIIKTPIFLIRVQANCANQKNECAYGKALEVLFSGNFVLSSQTDCLSPASYLFEKMQSTKFPEN